MTYLRFLWHGCTFLKELWRQVKAIDAAGVARFSDQWWLEIRKWIEIRIVSAQKNQDTGWRALFQTDNQLLRGLQLLFKSDRIKEIAEARTPAARHEAEQRLYEKPTEPPPAYPCA